MTNTTTRYIVAIKINYFPQSKQSLKSSVSNHHVAGHHLPGEESGDAVVVLRVQDHPVFTRRGAHLFMEKEISLTEAMCGVELVVDTLDGRSLLVSFNARFSLEVRGIFLFDIYTTTAQ